MPGQSRPRSGPLRLRSAESGRRAPGGVRCSGRTRTAPVTGAVAGIPERAKFFDGLSRRGVRPSVDFTGRPDWRRSDEREPGGRLRDRAVSGGQRADQVRGAMWTPRRSRPRHASERALVILQRECRHARNPGPSRALPPHWRTPASDTVVQTCRANRTDFEFQPRGRKFAGDRCLLHAILAKHN